VTDELYIGLDLGTSSLKGVAVTAGGDVVARGHSSYPTHRARPEWAEQDPADWRRALHDVTAQLLASAPASRWRALGLSGMIPTLVVVDGEGSPLRPALIWEDARAEVQGERLRRLVGEERLYAETGQWVDGRYLLPMYAWQVEHDPALAPCVGRVLGAKDHLFRWLTGEYATDPSTASGFGCYGLASGAWLDDVVAAAGLASSCLPAVLPATTTAPLARAAAEPLALPAGLPVCLGAADSVLGLLGLGVTTPGEVAVVAGTSTVLLGLSDRLLTDERHRFLVTPLAGVEGWGLEMDLLSTGSAIRWLGELLTLPDEAAAVELAQRAPPGADGLCFLPYLGAGEQGALWDPDLRGTLFGLGHGHGRAALARALVEGIVLEMRRCLGVLDEVGLAHRAVRVAGESASSPFVRRLLADATGRQVTLERGAEESSARGAAMLSALALDDEVARPRSGAETTLPDPAAAPLWDRLWERHERFLRGARRSYSV
jgi:xylulokinase